MKTVKNNGLRFVEDQDEETSVWEQKKALRTRMRNLRSEIVNRDGKEGLLVENVLAVLSEMTGAGTKPSCFIYLSYSSEAPTDRLIETLLEKGYSVYCPRIEQGEMVAVTYGEDFSLSAYGIREPLGTLFDGSPDLAITPLLAADKQGNRLGYGGGYYDRYFKTHNKTLRIGYAFDAQLVERLPATQEDERLDMLVTEQKILRFSRTC